MISSYINRYYTTKAPPNKAVFFGKFSDDTKTTDVRFAGWLNSGNGSITGKVTELGLPVARRVMLYERYSGNLVDIVWSDSAGNYTFKNINPELTYFVVSLDENGDAKQFNLVGQDMLRGDYDTNH